MAMQKIGLPESGEFIDFYETKKTDGTICYVDEFTYKDNLKKAEEKNEREKQELKDLLRRVRNNNPLNKPTFSKQSSSDFIRSLADYDDDCISTTDGVIIVDDFKQAFNMRRQSVKSRCFSLKRAVATVGVVFGLIAAVKTACNYILDSNHHIRVEAPTKPENDMSIIQKRNRSRAKVDTKDMDTSKKIPSILPIGDPIQLDNTQLYYSSDGQKPSVKTKKLACDSYKINRIAILSNDGKSIIKNFNVNKLDPNMNIEDFKENCRLIYGEDIKFKINVHGVIGNQTVYKQAGWTSMKNVRTEKVKVNRKV